jgi:hypothetical protein
MNLNLKTHNTLLQLSFIMGRLDGEKAQGKKTPSKLPSMHGGALMGVSSLDWKILSQTFNVPCNG